MKVSNKVHVLEAEMSHVKVRLKRLREKVDASQDDHSDEMDQLEDHVNNLEERLNELEIWIARRKTQKKRRFNWKIAIWSTIGAGAISFIGWLIDKFIV